MQKDINFYTGLKELRVKESVSAATVILGVLIAISVGLLIGGAYLIKEANDVVLDGIDALHGYLTGPENKALAEDTLRKRAIENLYNQYGEITGEAYDSYYTLPILDSADFGLISAAMPEDMKVVQFTFESGGVVMDCECKNEDTPVIFANALKDTQLFSHITYNGYLVSTDGVVTFKVIGVHKGGDRS
ncbi:MAG: hypothetical protein ACERKO_11895 [Acetanaerobacterium sp.]